MTKIFFVLIILNAFSVYAVDISGRIFCRPNAAITPTSSFAPIVFTVEKREYPIWSGVERWMLDVSLLRLVEIDSKIMARPYTHLFVLEHSFDPYSPNQELRDLSHADMSGSFDSHSVGFTALTESVYSSGAPSGEHVRRNGLHLFKSNDLTYLRFEIIGPDNRYYSSDGFETKYKCKKIPKDLFLAGLNWSCLTENKECHF